MVLIILEYVLLGILAVCSGAFILSMLFCIIMEILDQEGD